MCFRWCDNPSLRNCGDVRCICFVRFDYFVGNGMGRRLRKTSCAQCRAIMQSQAGNFSGSRTRQRVFQALTSESCTTSSASSRFCKMPYAMAKKCSTVRANDHFKCLAVAVNDRPILFAFTGIHFVAIYSLDVRDRDSARIIFRERI